MKNDISCSKEMREYFDCLDDELKKAYRIASEARSKGLDPEMFVEIPLAEDLAARVENLVGPVGVAERIRELSRKHDREELSLIIAKEVVRGEYRSREEALYQAIRTGLAILTEGVLVAPLEGVVGVKIKRNNNGTHFLSVYFAGPIRSAGGTGQALSVLIADVVRRELGLSRYIPTDDEIERYKEEITVYRQTQHLQYTPSPREIELITRHCPVCIDGEGTEKEEVSGYRDLPRVETNRVRGGAALVIAEGLCLKAPKIQRHVKNLKIDGWDFIDAIVEKHECNEQEKEILPNSKYIDELIAGRPVFSHPSRKGGFRLRYGRARTTGLAAVAINPAMMVLVNNFLAVGTQIKIERPGKAGIVTPCNEIEGPIVLLNNGDLIQINDLNEAERVKDKVKEIVDLGEILIPYGEFLENNHLLIQGSYAVEWWMLELGEAVGEGYERFLSPSPEDAFRLSEQFSIPLHPNYNLFWHDISREELIKLRDYILGHGSYDDGKLYLPANREIKGILIKLGALHNELNGEMVVEQYAYPLIRCTGLEIENSDIVSRNDDLGHGEIIDLVSSLANIKVMPRSPTRIGARMGRPEKARERKMKPAPHVLFPLGQAGGMQRLVKEAVESRHEVDIRRNNLRGDKITKTISVEVGLRRCGKCGRKGFLPRCRCGSHTYQLNGKPQARTIDVGALLENAKERLGERDVPNIKGVLGLISAHKTPETLEKGILRAKHEIFVFKDGTVRFDMTDAPLTHFTPKEIGTCVERLCELGYTHDCYGKPLESEEQIIEMKVQDFIPSRRCGEYLLRTARFVDELLEKFYGLKPYYNANRIEDLVGHLIIGLAPHTSSGVLGRIIGFTDAQVGYAHPFYHAAKRRNCDGDEDCVMLLLDGLLNFSKSYLPSTRGGLMDAPLVLTTRIDPKEIDKEALNIDVMFEYPLKFYDATTKLAHPKELESVMDVIGSRLESAGQYENFGFTHNTASISEGPEESAYKTLHSMDDKCREQLDLARKICAVDESDVASKLIETHFLPDIIGNLKSFSTQQVRCSKCNAKYRRMPLRGYCLKCGHKLTLTVHEGSVIKYLNASKTIARNYKLPKYTVQRIELMERAIDSVFQSDKVRKCKLSDFM